MVSPKKRLQHLQRALDRKARKLQRKRETKLTKRDLKKIRIQTVDPFKRWVFGIAGLVFLVIGIFGYLYSDFIVITLLLACIGVLSILLAIWGKPRTVESAFRGVDSGLTDQIFSSILDGLL